MTTPESSPFRRASTAGHAGIPDAGVPPALAGALRTSSARSITGGERTPATMQACLRRSHVRREHEWIASFARHANGQTSAERTPASLRPRVPGQGITEYQNTAGSVADVASREPDASGVHVRFASGATPAYRVSGRRAARPGASKTASTPAARSTCADRVWDPLASRRPRTSWGSSALEIAAAPRSGGWDEAPGPHRRVARTAAATRRREPCSGPMPPSRPLRPPSPSSPPSIAATCGPPV